MSNRIAAITVAVAVTASLLAGCASKSKSASSQVSTSATEVVPSTVTFNEVTVVGAATLASKPQVQAKSVKKPSALEIKDLVVGTGAAATPASTVTVQYVGVRYADGKQFDASWDHGGATSFSLQQVVPGFTQGIGGSQGVPAMKVGGRRLMILPAALGYGTRGTPDGSIPPNSPIVFVVDLVGLG